MLGLAPSEHLRQVKAPSLFQQLLEKNIIHDGVFSIMRINGQEGVLSVGGTSAEAVTLVQEQTRRQLDRLGELERGVVNGQTDIAKRDPESSLATQEHASHWRSGWKWSKVQGAEGWWQILMQGVWVDGSKVLKNQPVVIDVRIIFTPAVRSTA